MANTLKSRAPYLNDNSSIVATILGPQKISIIACFRVIKNKKNATSVKLKQMQNASKIKLRISTLTFE